METNEKRVLVTGGGSGIGAAMCRRFAADGATVVVADMNAEAAQAVADEIGGVALTADVGSPEANEASRVAHFTASFGAANHNRP